MKGPGLGSVYQRKSDGRWVGKYQFRDPFTNKIKSKYVYSNLPGRKGQQEVKRKLNELIEQIEGGNISKAEKITVDGWLRKFMEVYCTSLSQTTKDGYNIYIEKHIIPMLGKIKLVDLKPLHIQNFYNTERKKGYSEKTILQEHRILHRAFKKAVGEGLIPKNPCDSVDAPSPEEYKPTIYTEEEFLLLLDKLKGHPMEAIILIAGMCGLRRGELLALTWDDIDLEKGIIRVNKNTVATSEGIVTKEPKTQKSTREFAIPSIIIPRLKQLRGIGKLYVKPDGTDYHPGSVSKAFNTFLKKNNLKHIRLHDLRHFNCTMMLKYGISTRAAMERSGHSNINMLTKYQHILKEMDKENAEKLNDIFKKKNEYGVKYGVKQ